MLVTIIIPTYNRIEFVTKAIDSVVNQDYKNWELIIIDDGSDDQSFEILSEQYQKYANIKILTQTNKGVSSARNLGIKNASGEWIAFLDSDDFFHNNKLTSQVDYIIQNPDYTLCHTEEIWYRDGVRINPHKKHQKLDGSIFANSVKICSISISTVMVHKSIVKELGDFDESMPACEDYDFWLRITAKYPVLFLNEYLTTKHGGHADQLSRKYYAMDRFRIYALNKIITEGKLNIDQQELALAEFNKKKRILLKGAIKHDNKQLINEINEYKI
ncbi:glycosyltransferase [Rickettsiales bacterium]|nr:glycosyltransferase [Rickettsiales bacterium]